MLGLQVNSFVGAGDMDECKDHRKLAEKMDLNDFLDIITPHPVVPLATREEPSHAGGWGSDGDDDAMSPRGQPSRQEDLPDLARHPMDCVAYLLGEDDMDAKEAQPNVTPIRVPHTTPSQSPFGTPTSRVGLPSTAGPSRAARLMAERDADLAAETGCTASSGGGEPSEHAAPLPPMDPRDMLELISRPDIDSYRASRRQRNKTPYNEYPEGAVLEISDEDEDEVRLYASMSALPSEPGKVKKEPMSVSELDEKMEKRMKEELDTRLREANEEHARKMAAIQAEMEQARLESARRHADLMAQNQQFLAQSQQFMSMMASLQARPPVVYAAPDPVMSVSPLLVRPPSSSHTVYIPEHSYPAPALVVPPPPQVAAAPEPSPPAIGDDEDVNIADAPLPDEDVHMRGSQDSSHEDQPFVGTQASQAGGADTVVVEDTEGEFTGARPGPGTATGPGEGGTAGKELTAEEVINL